MKRFLNRLLVRFVRWFPVLCLHRQTRILAGFSADRTQYKTQEICNFCQGTVEEKVIVIPLLTEKTE